MAHSYFKPPDYLDYESVQELPKCWENWKKQFLIFMEATESNSKSDGVKVSMFLNLIGQKGVELYETFTFADGDNQKLDKVIEKFEEHASLHKSVTVNRYLFFRERQKDGQSLENYIKQLTTMCNSCNFDKDNTIKDNLLRDMIISGIIDKRLQEKLLRLEDNQATLANVINICRTHEVSIEHGQKLENECQATEAVNKIGVQQHNKYGMVRVNQNRRNGNMAMYGKNNGNDMVYDSEQRNRIKPLYQHNVDNCYFCGRTHYRGKCSAYGKNATIVCV